MESMSAIIAPAAVQIVGPVSPWRRCISCGTDCGKGGMVMLLREGQARTEGLCVSCSRMLTRAARRWMDRGRDL